jgi:hypothetical protein
MKKFVSVLLIIIIMFCTSACMRSDKNPVILDNSSKSSFTDFYTEGDTVYIECVLNIYNPSDKPVDVKINAIDNEDVEIGLLKSAALTGKAEDGNEIFTIDSGENQVTVLFVGEFAGIYQITQREIPRFINIEKS